ncbi:hypothetical protein ACYPKM_05005 [Pseudomonas aeruginosa]
MYFINDITFSEEWVAFSHEKPEAVAEWLVEQGRYPAFRTVIDSGYRINRNDEMCLGSHGLINAFVEHYAPEARENRRALIKKQMPGDVATESFLDAMEESLDDEASRANPRLQQIIEDIESNIRERSSRFFESSPSL